jgi:hypothetical protein
LTALLGQVTGHLLARRSYVEGHGNRGVEMARASVFQIRLLFRDSPFRYSGRPVISSIPSNFQPNIFSIGSSRLYVVQPVSLWNGTKSFPSSELSSGSEFLSEVHGQTSPSETPASDKRDGQITESPVMRACQRAATGTTVFPSSTFDSFSRKSDDWDQHARIFGIDGGNFLTDNIPGSGILSEELGVGRERFGEVYQQRCPTLQSDHRIRRCDLKGRGRPLDSDARKSFG